MPTSSRRRFASTLIALTGAQLAGMPGLAGAQQTYPNKAV